LSSKLLAEKTLKIQLQKELAQIKFNYQAEILKNQNTVNMVNFNYFIL
jgi:hypothetical protein